MATAIHRPIRMAEERWFFFVMSIVIFATAIAEFGSDIVVGHVWFTDFPWQVHVHAVVFTSWIVLYVVQNWLVVNGHNIMLHRRLGWLGAGIAAIMVPLGIAATVMAIARGSIAGIFPLGFFLAMDILGIFGFAALTFAAIRLRNHAGWHKRLMLCGTVLVIAPGIGRLVGPLPLGDFTPFALFAAIMLYILIGIVFDLIVLRRIHPAYWWGAATVALLQMLAGPIGFSPPVVVFAERLAS
ncbi:hypothetical protein [Sphingomonas sp. Leaf357]|uniref:hypothetical protein n=1 Tax=Sphingomonas sp. Leaf357 TaxID=1736350 RepID=UPI0012E0E776|nr:hypothetical protein [Sphingomonas sp. Leaf357]